MKLPKWFIFVCQTFGLENSKWRMEPDGIGQFFSQTFCSRYQTVLSRYQTDLSEFWTVFAGTGHFLVSTGHLFGIHGARQIGERHFLVDLEMEGVTDWHQT